VQITGRENLNTVAFQCSRKQKRQNYGVQNNYIDSNAKIKGFTVIWYQFSARNEMRVSEQVISGLVSWLI